MQLPRVRNDQKQDNEKSVNTLREYMCIYLLTIDIIIIQVRRRYRRWTECLWLLASMRVGLPWLLLLSATC